MDSSLVIVINREWYYASIRFIPRITVAVTLTAVMNLDCPKSEVLGQVFVQSDLSRLFPYQAGDDTPTSSCDLRKEVDLGWISQSRIYPQW